MALRDSNENMQQGAIYVHLFLLRIKCTYVILGQAL